MLPVTLLFLNTITCVVLPYMMSGLPSSSISAIANPPVGAFGVSTMGASNEIVPLKVVFLKITMVLFHKVKTRSGLPSPSRSPIADKAEVAPTKNSFGEPNDILPELLVFLKMVI